MAVAQTALYNATVRLTRSDAYHIIVARVSGAMRRAGATPDAIRDFQREATTGDLDHLLATARIYVNVE